MNIAENTGQQDILEFSGESRWLSNFWPCAVTLDGMLFSSVEAAYVAAKTECRETREKIQQMNSPGAIKRYGRTFPLRSDWEAIKLDVMRHLLEQKFAPGTELGQRLVDTGDCKIVEGNLWGDEFWGVCRGKGQNHLGKMLMEIRYSLKLRIDDKNSRQARPRL